MTDRAATNLAGSLPEFRSIDAQALADALPEPDASSFVHLDAYVGNVLTDGLRITAVIDIGVSSVAGDRRLDPLAAVVDLLSPQITPMATTAGRRRGDELAAECRSGGLPGASGEMVRGLLELCSGRRERHVVVSEDAAGSSQGLITGSTVRTSPRASKMNARLSDASPHRVQVYGYESATMVALLSRTLPPSPMISVHPVFGRRQG